MAEDLKISQLPAVTNPTGAEMLPAAVPGSGGSANTNGKLTLEQIVEKSQAGMVSEETWNAERKQFTLTGYIANDDGRVVGSDTAWSDVSDLAAGNFSLHTEFIPVNRKYDIKVYSRPTTIQSAVAFYDANQKFISCYKTETTPSDFYEWTYAKADIPADAVFFRLSSYVDKGQKLPWYIHAPNIESREGATSDAIAKGKVALFDDMWVKLTGGFTTIDRTTNPAKPYICNGVPLSYEDALVVAKYGNYEMAMNILDNRSWGTRDKIPTLKATLPTIGINGLDYPEIAWHPIGLRKIQFSVSPNNFSFILAGNLVLTRADLEEIADVLVPSKQCHQIGTMNGDMPYATGLHTLWIKGIDHNIAINLTALKLECWQYLVTNAANGTTVITVTVHPTVYAKLADTANTEWHAVMTAAAAKNISFATNA